jgi:hypothetical protein
MAGALDSAAAAEEPSLPPAPAADPAASLPGARPSRRQARSNAFGLAPIAEIPGTAQEQQPQQEAAAGMPAAGMGKTSRRGRMSDASLLGPPASLGFTAGPGAGLQQLGMPERGRGSQSDAHELKADISSALQRGRRHSRAIDTAPGKMAAISEAEEQQEEQQQAPSPPAAAAAAPPASTRKLELSMSRVREKLMREQQERAQQQEQEAAAAAQAVGSGQAAPSPGPGKRNTRRTTRRYTAAKVRQSMMQRCCVQ